MTNTIATAKLGPGTLDRRAVVKALLQDRKELLVVTGLGSSSYDVMAAGDHTKNFYLWGAMGGAAVTGLGIAVAQPSKPVAVITGDGEQLMGIGALATIGVKKVKNLTLVVLDNAHYGETGMQASHTGLGVDLVAIASNCGFAWAETITDMAGVEALRPRLLKPEGPGFALIRIAANDPPRVLPPRDGVFVKNRFRASLGLTTI
ncbi:MAG: aldehyde dehydrogenase [Hyphomicrobiaceae bacterium]|nr:aldehyde dehydrogenase [Hyphomicrobiaceae bacterium]